MHFIDEKFWIAVSFVIFLYFAYRPLRKALVSTLDAKILEIKKQLEEAVKLRSEAAALLQEVTLEVDKFSDKKNELVESSKKSSDHLMHIREKELESILMRKKKLAIQSIENHKIKASEEMVSGFTDSVFGLVRQYLSESQNNSTSDKELISRFVKK